MRAPVAGAAAAVELVDLTVSYGDRVALDGVSLRVEPGNLVGVIGPNGAGKSTLLKTLLGVLRPTRGAARVFGQEPRAARRRVAYVPQREHVAWDFPISVEEVVLHGSYRRVGWLRRPGRVEREAALAALDRVGMADRRDGQIGELSGGQQQRVFIARALLQLGGLEAGPALMLLDEPLAGVDAGSGETVLGLLRELARAGHTVLMSTHDLNVAAATCDRMLLLNRRVTGYGRPDEVFNPEVLGRTYGDHALVFSSPSMAFGVLDDGAHHHGDGHVHRH
jgi:ABC-type Mn2+/Zn2+ transport system ATPase subunit